MPCAKFPPPRGSDKLNFAQGLYIKYLPHYNEPPHKLCIATQHPDVIHPRFQAADVDGRHRMHRQLGLDKPTACPVEDLDINGRCLRHAIQAETQDRACRIREYRERVQGFLRATLCNQCGVVCPVKIPLPDLLRKLREQQFERGLKPKMETWGLALWRWTAQRPKIYAMLASLAARLLAAMGNSERLIHILPLGRGWTQGRDMPAPQGKTFRALYQARRSRQ